MLDNMQKNLVENYINEEIKNRNAFTAFDIFKKMTIAGNNVLYGDVRLLVHSIMSYILNYSSNECNYTFDYVQYVKPKNVKRYFPKLVTSVDDLLLDSNLNDHNITNLKNEKIKAKLVIYFDSNKPHDTLLENLQNILFEFENENELEIKKIDLQLNFSPFIDKEN